MYLGVAKGLCAELKTQLLIARNLKNIVSSHYKLLNHKSNEIGKQLNGFIKYLRSAKAKRK